MAKRGRPKQTLSTLPEGWQDVVIDLYAKGASDVEVRAQIAEWRGSFTFDLWERWLNEEPEFSEAIKKGRLKSQAWWESMARYNLENPRFNATLWYMNMKNRFGWRDKPADQQDESLAAIVSKLIESRPD